MKIFKYFINLGENVFTYFVNLFYGCFVHGDFLVLKYLAIPIQIMITIIYFQTKILLIGLMVVGIYICQNMKIIQTIFKMNYNYLIIN